MNKKNVNNCPWCGGVHIEMKVLPPANGHMNDTKRYQLYCVDCKMRGPLMTGLYGTLNAWNELPQRHKLNDEPKEGGSC